MSKHCPVCGAEFPDYANVCDQHGAALVGRRHRYLWPLGAAALLAVAALATRAWVSQQFFVARITEVRIVKAKQVMIEAYVFNGVGLPSAGEYQLNFAGVAGHAEQGQTEIQPGTSRRMAWTVPLTDAVTRPPEEGLPVALRGRMRISLLGLDWAVPFERRFVVKLSRVL